ncbi:MAG: 3-hydroxyacyl-CoA dehydrogenase family protein [Bacteroidota bacterium]
MFIVVSASEDQKKEFLQKGFPPELEVEFFANNEPVSSLKNIDAYFDFSAESLRINNIPEGIPVFKNAVTTQLQTLPNNFIRINAWPGFINRSITEIVYNNNMEEKINRVMNALQWKFIRVNDIPGMIAARIVSMIINEAWFALDDKVSTKTEIDIAMKLGTNYPFGPFEWGEKIGLQNVINLLKKLSETDSRYEPSHLLLNTFKS